MVKGAEDDEWQTVRSSRRRTTSSTQATVSSLKKNLPIPVVPLAIRALAVEETEAERLQRERERAVKALKKKKRAASLKEQASDSTAAQTGVPSTQPKLSSAAAATAETSQAQAISSSKPLFQPKASNEAVSSLAASFLRYVMAFVEWLCKRLGIVLNKTATKKLSHKSRKAVAAAAGGIQKPASVSSQSVTEPNAPTGDSSASAAGKTAAAAETKLRSESQGAGHAAVSPTVAKGVTASPAATQAKASSSMQDSQQKQAVIAAADAVKGSSSSHGAPAVAAVAAAQAKPPSGSAAHPAVPTSRAAAGSGWKDGRFYASHVSAAHADVLTGVTVAGELVLTAGYDGAVKVWSWPKGSTSAPRYLKSLVGHTGRVEAVCSNPASNTAVTSGRDSMLKVWHLDAADGARGSKEVASHYVYESVKSMVVDWTAPGGGSAFLGSRSGSISLWQLETGRKLQVLKNAHSEEVSVLHLQGQMLVSGGRDELVHVWDLRQAGRKVAALRGAKSRVCSLASIDHTLFVGDCSSSVKVFDLRALREIGTAAATQKPSAQEVDSAAMRLMPSSHIPNVPTFAGDVCPVAGLWYSAKQGVLISSSIAWWTQKTEALEEAPDGEGMLPLACLNIFSVGTAAAVSYAHTLRVSQGVVTCIASDEEGERLLVGNATGGLSVLSLVQGRGKVAEVASEGEDSAVLLNALNVGVQEFSDDEGDDEEDSEEAADSEEGA